MLQNRKSYLNEPHHEKTCFLPYGNNKGADQPAHLRSLISTFVLCCLDSIIPLLAIAKISSLYLASVAAQAGLCLTWSQTPKTGFLVMWLKQRFLYTFHGMQLLPRIYEMQHGKTKWYMHPTKTYISLGICPVRSESSLSTWKQSWVLSFPLSIHQRLIRLRACLIKADLSLHWAHRSFCWFCHAVFFT